MKRKKILKILSGIAILAILIKFSTIVFVESWAREKIETSLNNKSGDYQVGIDKVRISLLRSGIELEHITISSNQERDTVRNISGGISSVKFKGIGLLRAIFRKDIAIRKVVISNAEVRVKIQFPEESKILVISPMNIRIGNIYLDKINLLVENVSNAHSLSVKEGILRINNLRVEKQDTLSAGLIKELDFEAEELISVSSDSMYVYSLSDVSYMSASDNLRADGFSIHPNYKDYEFTSRHEYQTNCIEAGFSNIACYDFDAPEYLRSGSLISSYIEIGKMDMKIFRDKRKQFRHVNKPAFQDMIYSYPGTLSFDSINLIKGDVVYTVHSMAANDSGTITFNEIKAKIYNITNDTISKTRNDSLILKGNALLMGKGKMTILLKGRIFDSQNTFSLSGSLSELEAKELNPILEKSAFIYATSGKINRMNYFFTANNTKASGRMTLLYNGLDVAYKNKRTDDTTAFREKLISFIANRKLLDSNPDRNEDVRVGIIDYERDPEKFLFDYCFRSILSGIKSSIVKNPK